MVEKHITLSNDTKGLDDPVALNPKNFKIMCNNIRKYQNIPLDSGIKELSELYTENRIEKILGTGIKKLAPSEALNYGRTNRSLHALHNIKKGELLTHENSALLRTEKVLNPGMEPYLAPTFYNKP
jgi:sialic acid synthase SpsE